MYESKIRVPDLEPMYEDVCKYVREHQGKKGYIDVQPYQENPGDIIYTYEFVDMSGQFEERMVYGVRVIDEGEGEDLQICFEQRMNTYRLIYTDDVFRGECKDEPDANAEWYSVRWSDAVLYVPTIFNLAECIEEYGEDDEPTYLGGKKWDELSDHDKGIVSDLEI